MVTALQSETFTLAPQLPARWKRLAFRVVWRGVPLRADITANRCALTNLGQDDLPVRVWGEGRQLAGGETTVFDKASTGSSAIHSTRGERL